MNRLDPARIAAVFREQGITPERQLYVLRDEHGHIARCCGLSAALVERDALKQVDLDAQDQHSEADAAEEFAAALGLHRLYAWGFLRGWDGRHEYGDEDRPAGVMARREDEYRVGYDDGLAAWHAATTPLAP